MNISFEDGYDKYPDDYEEPDSRNVFQADTSLWEGLLLNPPWEEKLLQSHVSFLAKVADSNWAHLFVVIPYRPAQHWFQQLWTSPNHAFLIFNNPVSFYRIEDNYSGEGICHMRVAVWLCGIRGPRLI